MSKQPLGLEPATKPTKVLRNKKNDKPSTTDPTDPDAVPAFETSAGIPARSPATKPVMVNKYALENFNNSQDPVVIKHQMEAANVAALFSKRAIRPDEVAALRRRMFEVVTHGLEDVAEVMAGSKVWSNTQVRLFSILTERVMPKLSTISVDDNSAKKLDEMSMEELEGIVLGRKKHEAIDAVVKQGQELNEAAEKSESLSAAKKLKNTTIKLTSIDAAEKAYSADQAKLAASDSRSKKKPV